MQPVRSKPARIALVAAGVVCVGIGTVGVFVPVLPTTPFLLLAAACFMRSSQRLHTWLIEHPRLGPYVRGFVDGEGVPRRVKKVALLTLWPFVALSIAIVAIGTRSWPSAGVFATLVLTMAALVTRYILKKPTRAEDSA